MVDPSINEHRRRLDRLQLVALAALMFIGAAFIYSATLANPTEAAKAWFAQSWFHQIIWYALGLGAAAALCVVDYHSLARWSFVAYGVRMDFFACLRFFIRNVGTVHNGARRWINLGLFQLQPGEFAKLSFILAMGEFFEPFAGGIEIAGEFLEIDRPDAAAIYPDFQRAGFGFGARVAAGGSGDDACRRHAETIFTETRRVRRNFWRVVSRGRFICTAQIPDSDSRLSAAKAAGLFRRKFRG